MSGCFSRRCSADGAYTKLAISAAQRRISSSPPSPFRPSSVQAPPAEINTSSTSYTVMATHDDRNRYQRAHTPVNSARVPNNFTHGPAQRIIHGDSRALLRKEGRRLGIKRNQRLTCSFGCIGTFRTEIDRRQHMLYAHNMEPIRDINEDDFRKPFFEGTDDIDQVSTISSMRTNRKPLSVLSVSIRPRRKNAIKSTFRQIRTMYSSVFRPSEAVFAPRDGYHYTKRAMTRGLPEAPRKADISRPIPDAKTLAVSSRIAVDLATAQRSLKHRSVTSEDFERAMVERNINETASLPSLGPTTLLIPPPRDFETDSVTTASVYSAAVSPMRRNVLMLEEGGDRGYNPTPNSNLMSLVSSPTSTITPPSAFSDPPPLIRAVVPLHVMNPLPSPPTSPEPSRVNRVNSFSRPTPSAYPYLAKIRATHGSMTDLKTGQPRSPRKAPPPMKPLPSRLPPPVSVFDTPGLAPPSQNVRRVPAPAVPARSRARSTSFDSVSHSRPSIPSISSATTSGSSSASPVTPSDTFMENSFSGPPFEKREPSSQLATRALPSGWVVRRNPSLPPTNRVIPKF